jgi:hypothetical protein
MLLQQVGSLQGLQVQLLSCLLLLGLLLLRGPLQHLLALPAAVANSADKALGIYKKSLCNIVHL